MKQALAIAIAALAAVAAFTLGSVSATVQADDLPQNVSIATALCGRAGSGEACQWEARQSQYSQRTSELVGTAESYIEANGTFTATFLFQAVSVSAGNWAFLSEFQIHRCSYVTRDPSKAQSEVCSVPDPEVVSKTVQMVDGVGRAVITGKVNCCEKLQIDLVRVAGQEWQHVFFVRLGSVSCPSTQTPTTTTTPTVTATPEQRPYKMIFPLIFMVPCGTGEEDAFEPNNTFDQAEEVTLGDQTHTTAWSEEVTPHWADPDWYWFEGRSGHYFFGVATNPSVTMKVALYNVITTKEVEVPRDQIDGVVGATARQKPGDPSLVLLQVPTWELGTPVFITDVVGMAIIPADLKKGAYALLEQNLGSTSTCIYTVWDPEFTDAQRMLSEAVCQP